MGLINRSGDNQIILDAIFKGAHIESDRGTWIAPFPPPNNEAWYGDAAMSNKHYGGPAPIPPGNHARSGNSSTTDKKLDTDQKAGEVASQQEEPSNRIGDYNGKGEHSIQEPGGKNGANH